MSHSVERVDLAAARPPWREEHLARYRWAQGFVEPGQLVLDLACGTGEGAAELVARGARVLAIDIDPDAVRRALGTTPSACVADGTILPLADGTVDVITSFETIEHVPEPGALLMEFARVLRPGGHLLLSTPNALATNPGGGTPSNPFHVREFTPTELRALVPPTLDVAQQVGQDLPLSYGPAPFLPRIEPARPGWRLARLRWKLLLRLPPLRNALHRAFVGFDFYPDRSDWVFESASLPTAHVQCLVARRSGGRP